MFWIDRDRKAAGRRGWLRAKDVLNTLPLPSVRKRIAKKRARA
ncbi:MAG TPA: hypothetical protein VJZ71_08305 [Phycisphaerae bacterium]|nr:hypothetical protein [Phycisphaerae bacterium]